MTVLLATQGISAVWQGSIIHSSFCSDI